MNKILLLLVACLGFSRAAETGDLASFFPMEKGRTWTYDTTDRKAKKHFDMSVEIQDSWSDGELHGMILKQKDKRGTMREFLIKKDDGIFIHKLGLSKSYTPEVFSNFSPPVPRVIAPLTPGTKVHWEGRLKAGALINQDIRFSGEVIGWEDVTVPAGTFHCIKLFYDQYRGGEHVQQYAWYAKDVGQVKYDGGPYVKELKEFKKP